MNPMEGRVPATVSVKEACFNCCNPPTQQEGEGDSQQSDVDSDEFAGEESD